MAEQIEGNHTFGQWVKRQRKALGLTQADLAQRAACSKSMINKIESDQRNPTKPLLELLAQKLKIPPIDYAEFVHLAQPHLLVEPDVVSNKQVPSTGEVSQKPIKAQLRPLTLLIGREREVTSVSSLLQQPGIRLLTLTGAGGIGKTRLVLEVAAELKDKFVDGVYFVSLAPVRDTSLVLSTIVQALGLKSTHDQRDDELLISNLSEKATLLILDNFEQVLSAKKVIADLLASTDYLKILITSRALLRVTGEHEFIMPPLDVPNSNMEVDLDMLSNSAAAQLFVQRAQAVRTDFMITPENAHSVSEICRRLDGLPLAIELAAARCKVLTPQAILTRLTGTDGALGLLAGGPQDLPARQQTIRQTIEWSYNLLSEREQVLFRRLAIFVGGFTLDAIEDVYNKLHTQSQPRSRPVLYASGLDLALSLMDHSLLRQVETPDGEPRFFMSETLREFAIESLTESNELEMMRQQHATYFLQLVEASEAKLHGAEQESCLQRLDLEYNNIRAALMWSSASDIQMALRIAGVIWEFWLIRGYLSEGRVWLQDLLKRQETMSMLPARARILNVAGLLISVQGDLETANNYLQESLRLYRELNDKFGEAWALNHLGQTLVNSGQQEQAISFFEVSLNLFRDLGADWNSAWVLVNLGEANINKGETDHAFQLLQESYNIFIRHNYKRGMAAAIDRLGRLAILHRDPSQAITLFSESLRLYDEIGDRQGSAWSFYNLGRITDQDGQKHKALGYLIEGLRLFDKVNDRWGFAWSLFRLANVLRDLQYTEQAAMLFGATTAMNITANNRMSVSQRDFIYESLKEARGQSNAAAWATGQTLSSEKVLAWILNQSFSKNPESQ